MANSSDDYTSGIRISVFASTNGDKKAIEEVLKEQKATTCRFSVAIIVLKNKDQEVPWGNNITSIEKAIIYYERPVDIKLARTLRDKLVEVDVSEIKDCFYDKQDLSKVVKGSVKKFIDDWNICPEQESEKLKIGQFITLAKATKDAPINLYASAMIGEMGELLLKLNKLANSFAGSMLGYFSSDNADNGKTAASGSLAELYTNSKKVPNSKHAPKTKVYNIPKWKDMIKEALKKKDGNDLLRSEASPRLPKILLIGDSGVGKSLVANFIHETVKNMLASALGDEAQTRPARIGIPEFEKKEDDLEYSLFGYASGAYTGASENGNLGLLLDNICQVVFLDEIGAATSAIQNKLLTYLDSYQVRPRGMNDDIFCPTLIVAATNEQARLDNPKEFRSDLLARFTDRLVIPNIKERIAGKEENLLYLLDCILQVEDINPKPKVTSIGENAFEKLFKHFSSDDCKGNFRELENLMREACEHARNDKRDFMVEKDVEWAIDSLHLSLATSQEEQPKASASSENTASNQATAQTDIEQPAVTEETGGIKKVISSEQIDEFWEHCRILKEHEDVRHKILEIIIDDFYKGNKPKGQTKIIKALQDSNLHVDDFGKNFQCSVQRLAKAIRDHFKQLPFPHANCRKS